MTERFPQETGRSYAYRMIRENIISTELVPGSLVSEKELAQQLNLSRTPVREALIDLAQVGVVEVMPQRGSRISYIDSHMVEEAQFMRNTLERAVCRRLCTMEEQPDLTPLVRNLHAQEVAFSCGENEDFFRLDNEFHRLFYQLAGMLHIYQMSSSFMIHFDRLRNLSLSAQDNRQLMADHREMVDCLLLRDESGVDRVLERHLNRCKIDGEAIRCMHPAFFPEESR
ncbi:MAG: GntR family transcriptional regulator [Clostridiales bacterium]|nr:GntR family transcriptional regulator [Clostridiales bacterium]